MSYSAIISSKDKKTQQILNEKAIGDNTELTLSRDTIGDGFDRITVFYDDFRATDKETGYYVIPDTGWTRLAKINSEIPFGKYASRNLSMHFLAFNINGDTTVLSVIGMRDAYKLVCEKNENGYRYYIVIELDGKKPYEDIKFVMHKFKNNAAGINDIGKWYRNFLLDNNYCKPLYEKVKNREYLEYAVESINIRVRMAWKPVPATVMYQTIENEPDVTVACNFKMVEDLIDELKAAGVDKADICLVGWNISGHDGRWPQMFPVEPKLGGEEGLLHLLEKAKEAGYILNLHTNFLDAYTIADCFNEDYIIKNQDGSLATDRMAWSGGKMHHVALPYNEQYYIDNVKKLADMGFRGVHYTDVLSLAPPRKSYDTKHPMNEKDYCESAKNALKAIQKYHGASSSEGGIDLYADCLDYVLYSHSDPDKVYDGEEWLSESIPLWSVVFHGILLYNATTKNFNYSVKPGSEKMLFFLFGGRPCAYCFKNFKTTDNNDTSFKEDLRWQDGEKPTEVARRIAKMYNDYKKIRKLQYELIDCYDVLDDGSEMMSYSDGSKITINRNTGLINIDIK